MQFPSQHFGAAVSWGISISQVLEFPYAAPVFFYLEQIMDDYLLMFIWLLPLFLAVVAVRSIMDDLKRGKK